MKRNIAELIFSYTPAVMVNKALPLITFKTTSLNVCLRKKQTKTQISSFFHCLVTIETQQIWNRPEICLLDLVPQPASPQRISYRCLNVSFLRRHPVGTFSSCCCWESWGGSAAAVPASGHRGGAIPRSSDLTQATIVILKKSLDHCIRLSTLTAGCRRLLPLVFQTDTRQTRQNRNAKKNHRWRQ